MSTKSAPVRRRRAGWRQWGPGLLLISPSIILVGVFVYGMIGININTSLLDMHTAGQVSGRRGTTVVGLSNFTTLFGNPDFRHSFINLILFTVTFLAGTLVVGFLWAWLLDRPIKGEGVFRSIFLFPMAVSFVASGVVWRWLLNSAQGEKASGLNRLFEMTGLRFLENSWTQNTTWGILAIALPAVWQLAGYVMALFLAGFRGIPDDLREAARVDGAGMLRTYVSVVLPISVPSFVVVLIWQFTSAWTDFLFALFFGGGAQSGPVTLALNNLAHGSILADYGASMSGALIASVPTLAVYILLGKYFVGGLMAGSVKG